MTLASSGNLHIHNTGGTTRSIRYEINNSYAEYDLDADALNDINSGSFSSGWTDITDFYGYNHLHAPTMGLLSWADPDMLVNYTDTNTGETGYNFRRKTTGSYTDLGNWTAGSPFNDDPACGSGSSFTYYYSARAYITSTINQSGAYSSDSSGKEAICCLLGGHRLQVRPGEFKDIEDVRPGDLMYTAHHRDINDMSYFEVSSVQKNRVEEYYVVNFSDGSKIRCSKTHRFIVGNHQRKMIMRLRVGDTVIKHDGEFKDVYVTNILRIMAPEYVYKITVECGHSYITEDGILHHNEK